MDGHERSARSKGRVVEPFQLLIDPGDDAVIGRRARRPLAPPSPQPLAALACRELGSGLDRATPLACPGLQMALGPVAPHQELNGSPRARAHRGHEAQNHRPVTEGDALGGCCGCSLVRGLLKRHQRSRQDQRATDHDDPRLHYGIHWKGCHHDSSGPRAGGNPMKHLISRSRVKRHSRSRRQPKGLATLRRPS